MTHPIRRRKPWPPASCRPYRKAPEPSCFIDIEATLTMLSELPTILLGITSTFTKLAENLTAQSAAWKEIDFAAALRDAVPRVELAPPPAVVSE